VVSFDSIDQERLMTLVKRRVSDRRMLRLIRKWLRAGVLESGALQETLVGTPQGGVISPLLANIYLHELDRTWEAKCRGVGILVRYADDFVIVCRSEEAAKEAHRRVGKIMDWLKLKLHPEKTRIVHLRRKGIDFLGCHLRMAMSRKYRECWYLYRWPSQKAMRRIRERIGEITSPQHAGHVDRDAVLKRLSEVLRGWGEYFRTGNATYKFCQVDAYVRRRLVILEHRRRGLNQGRWRDRFDYKWYAGLPLYRLPGTIRYPGAANAA
jgi:RNA-directed DNA polymerase